MHTRQRRDNVRIHAQKTTSSVRLFFTIHDKAYHIGGRARRKQTETFELPAVMTASTRVWALQKSFTLS